MGHLFPLAYFAWSLFYGDRARDNPWGDTGLEWTVRSLPPVENFAVMPVVTHGPYNYPPPEAQAHA